MSPRRLITDQDVAGLPIAEGRAELLEEIMITTSTAHRTYRGLLVPLAAAASVVAVVGGAWALSAGEEPDPAPRGPGFGSSPTASAETSPAETASAGTPSESQAGSSSTCVVAYEESTAPPATDGPQFADCDDVILEEQSTDPVEERERYQDPPRPVLVTADGWRVEGVHNMDLDWVAADGAALHVTWVLTAKPDDPFAYDRYSRAGEEIEVLGRTSRLTGFSERGKDYQVLLTPGLTPDGTSLLIESSSLSAEEFREVVESVRSVTLAEYRRVVRPAVG